MDLTIVIQGIGFGLVGFLLQNRFKRQDRRFDSTDLKLVEISGEIGKVETSVAVLDERIGNLRADQEEDHDAIQKLSSKVVDIGEALKGHENRIAYIETRSDIQSDQDLVRILVVDDQEDACKFIYDYFHTVLPLKPEWKKYVFQVDCVHDYDSAIEKLEKHNDYNLGIFDYCLSKVDPRTGFLLGAHCKKNIKDRKFNFIIYSASDQLENIPKDMAEHFLVKPTTKTEWLAFENKLKTMI